MKKFLTIVLGFFMTASAALAQPRFSSQGHKGKVAAAFLDSASKSQAFYTVGQDGFIIRWENGIGEHFQVSDKKIFLAAISPNAKEIAFYESDEASYHSVKIWDAAAKKTKRSFLYKNQITSLSYSAKGTCLIATANERNGVYFYTASNGKSFSKIKDYETTASWAKTSESEKNVLLYSAAEGKLLYFSLKTGKPLKKVPAESGLENLVLFARNNFLAGTKNNSIYIFSAESGAKVKTIPCKSPILLDGSDSLLYVDGQADLHSIYKVDITESGVKGPLITKNIKAPGAPKFSAAFLAEEKIFLAAQDGNVYSADTSDNSLPSELALISNEVYQKIRGVCSDGNRLYILADSAIIKADYESKAVKEFPNLRDWTKIDCAWGKLILQNDNRLDGLRAVDAESGEEEFLFSAASRIKRIRAAEINGKKGFLEIENSKVNFYSFKDKSVSELYLGSGIQDAAAIDGNLLAVAKTASTNPTSPLVLVNLKTRETVPVKMDGDITVCLEESGGYLFGSRLISQGSGYTTSAFCMGIKALTVKDLASSAQEESDSFIKAEFPLAFTKIGVKDISVINVKTLKKHSLKSGASLPVDMAKCGGRIVSLNEDSSLTWHNVEQALPLADWYIDSKNQIVEF